MFPIISGEYSLTLISAPLVFTKWSVIFIPEGKAEESKLLLSSNSLRNSAAGFVLSSFAPVSSITLRRY